jgi:hypothetical protein
LKFSTGRRCPVLLAGPEAAPIRKGKQLRKAKKVAAKKPLVYKLPAVQ